jgi:hypothetical protein
MKKLIAACLLLTGSLSAGLLSGCTADNPMVTEDDLTVKSHFYPIVNGSKYTYIRYNNNSYDTVTYQVRVGEKRGDMNYLARVDSNNRVPQILYYFAYQNDQFGQPAAVLKDTSQFFALAGNLEKDGNPWIAQESPRVYAQVFNVYDQYVISSDIAFDGVIAVKYWQEGKGETDYTLRYYAKNFGLIKEKKIVGSATEIGSLQLIAKSDSYGNWIKTDGLPPIDHRLGKYRSIMMQQDDSDQWIR